MSSYQERKGKLSSLNVELPREGNKFVPTVYQKHIFSGVYTHFESFITNS